jgi:hypothetical protein
MKGGRTLSEVLSVPGRLQSRKENSTAGRSRFPKGCDRIGDGVLRLNQRLACELLYYRSLGCQ